MISDLSCNFTLLMMGLKSVMAGSNECNTTLTFFAFNIEIGAGLGPLAGRIWRVGLMGASSQPQLIVLLLAALDATLAAHGRVARA